MLERTGAMTGTVQRHALYCRGLVYRVGERRLIDGIDLDFLPSGISTIVGYCGPSANCAGGIVADSDFYGAVGGIIVADDGVAAAIQSQRSGIAYNTIAVYWGKDRGGGRWGRVSQAGLGRQQ